MLKIIVGHVSDIFTIQYMISQRDFWHLSVHVLLLAEFLLLVLLHDAALFICDPPRCVLHDFSDGAQSLLVRADGLHTF